MEMASHILQFSFVGIEGFEWPIGYFPTAEIDPVTLQHIYWEGVWALSELGFETFMAVCDGAQCNSSFILNHFGSTDAATVYLLALSVPIHALVCHMFS